MTDYKADYVMSRQILAYFTLVILLGGCATSPKARFSGAIENAKQAGRSVVVFGIHHGSRSVDRLKKGGYMGYGLSAGVAFITVGSTPIQSISFDFLPYSDRGDPLPKKIKRFTAKGPLLPNHVYEFVGPEVVWPHLSVYNCLRLVGMVIRRTDGAIANVEKDAVDRYVTSNVATRCTHVTPAVSPPPA
jgi:hypothetical protein